LLPPAQYHTKVLTIPPAWTRRTNSPSARSSSWPSPGSASATSQRYAIPQVSYLKTKEHQTNPAIPTQVDYKKLAGLAGFTNPASASNAWAKIQKKITAQAGPGAADSATPEAGTPKPTPAKKRGAKVAADGETPVKKARTPKTPKKVVKQEVFDDDEPASAGEDAGENMFSV
jgi:hypothetical protein